MAPLTAPPSPEMAPSDAGTDGAESVADDDTVKALADAFAGLTPEQRAALGRALLEGGGTHHEEDGGQ